jgi:hypothetical protein
MGRKNYFKKYRKMKKVLTNEQFIEKCNIKRGNIQYNYDLVNYKGSKVKVNIKCKTHGYFSMTPNNFLNGQNCPKCAINIQITTQSSNTETFIKKAMFVHPNYKYDDVNYINNHTKIKVKCDIENHGYFYIRPNNLLSGQGCAKCGGTKKLTNDEFISECKIIHAKKKYDYSITNYIKSIIKVKIICSKHGIFKILPHHFLNGHGCPTCGFNISKPEIEFIDYCNVPLRHFSPCNWKRKPVDGYNPDTNTIYEFLGDYWHGNPKKFKKEDFNKRSKVSFGELYSNTFKTFDKLKLLGYSIKYIWESDWKKFKKGFKVDTFIKSI